MSGLFARLTVAGLVGSATTLAIETDDPSLKYGLVLGTSIVCFGLMSIVGGGSKVDEGAEKSSKKKKKNKKKKASSQNEDTTIKEAPAQSSGEGGSKKNKKKKNSSSAAAVEKPKQAAPAAASADKKKKKNKNSSKAKPAPKVEEEEETADDDGDQLLLDTITGGNTVTEASMSKSAARRKRSKNNKAAAAAEELKQQSYTNSKPQVDADGFTTHVVKRRPRKPKPSAFEMESSYEPQAAVAEVDPNSITLELESIKPQQYGIVIGPGGATLKTLQEATNTRIDVPKKDGTGVQVVTVTGSRVEANRCKQAIESLIKMGYSSITDPGTVSGQIAVPPSKLGIVIGPGGANIRTLMEKTETKINTPDKGSDSNRVSIAGKKDNVRRAKDAIKQLMDLGFSDITHEGWVVKEVEFPADKYNLLIGPRGHTIKSIQGDTKCKINIPNSTSEIQDVTVVGHVSNVDRAIKQILRLITRDEEKQRAAEEAAANADSADEEWY